MRTLRAVLNYAQVSYEDSSGKSILPENPVRRLTQADIWRPVAARDNYIKKNKLKAWYQAVSRLTNTTLRDFLLLCLFSGLRRNEAARLQWQHIDFDEKTLTIPAQNRKKVGKKPMKPLTLPLTRYLENLLTVRYNAWKSNKVRPIDNDFVFAGEGKGGHIVEVKKAINRVTNKSKVIFSTHDLRRTYATIGETLVPYLPLKRLIGHHTTDDITSSYVIADVERLREPAETIAAYLEEHCGIQDQAERPTSTSEKVIALVS
jgi:integrase